MGNTCGFTAAHRRGEICSWELTHLSVLFTLWIIRFTCMLPQAVVVVVTCVDVVSFQRSQLRRWKPPLVFVWVCDGKREEVRDKPRPRTKTWLPVFSDCESLSLPVSPYHVDTSACVTRLIKIGLWIQMGSLNDI